MVHYERHRPNFDSVGYIFWTARYTNDSDPEAAVTVDSLQPSFMPEPPKQLPAVIYPLPQDFWLRCSPAIVIVGLKVALFFIILYAALKCILERFGAVLGHSGAPGSKLPDW